MRGPRSGRCAGVVWGGRILRPMPITWRAPHARLAGRPLHSRRAGPAEGASPLCFIQHYLIRKADNAFSLPIHFPSIVSKCNLYLAVFAAVRCWKGGGKDKPSTSTNVGAIWQSHLQSTSWALRLQAQGKRRASPQFVCSMAH